MTLKDLILNEPRCIKLTGKVVFVGDTHGDLDASIKVFQQFPDYTKVFTGDYVDRGPDSRGNIKFLLDQKLKDPDKVILLLGNHEAYPIEACYPNDFWADLEPKEYKFYKEILPYLPLVAYSKNIIACHGVPPDLTIDEINDIKVKSKQWHRIIWGDWLGYNNGKDWIEDKGGVLRVDWSTGRPQFGKAYFDNVMSKLNADILIRSHQPDVPLKMFDDRCYTIFTSSAYLGRRPTRTVISADLDNDEFNVIEI